MMWKGVFAASVVIVQCATVVRAQELKEQYHAIQDESLAGKIFTDEVVFNDTVTPSTVSCAQKCFTTAGCVAFTVRHLPANFGVVCRGHASTVTSSFSSVVIPGARLYYVKEMSAWLRKPCTSDQDCPVTRKVCSSNKCLCPDTFYYSRSQNLCVPRCSNGIIDATGDFATPDVMECR